MGFRVIETHFRASPIKAAQVDNTVLAPQVRAVEDLPPSVYCLRVDGVVLARPLVISRPAREKAVSEKRHVPIAKATEKG